MSQETGENKSTQTTEEGKPLPVGAYVVLSAMVLGVGYTLYLGVTKWLNFSAGIFCLFIFFYSCFTGKPWWHRWGRTDLDYGMGLFLLLFLAFICFVSSL